MANSNDNPTGTHPSPPQSETSDLAKRIQKVQAARAAANAVNDASGQRDATTLARGLRIGAEFVAAILVGSAIGYLIDMIAGTTPWALLIMFMVGFAAGILNVTRVVAELNATKSGVSRTDEAD